MKPGIFVCNSSGGGVPEHLIQTIGKVKAKDKA